MNRIIMVCFLILVFMEECAPKKPTKLMLIYKDRLLAYQESLNYKAANLKKKVKQDTVINKIEWRLDKHNFFKILEETNYYNLDLISVYAHEPQFRPASPSDPDKIVLSDVNFKYKNPIRKLCDTYIIKQSDIFNTKWKDAVIPKTKNQLIEYLTFKQETINYLLQNSCY